MTITISGWCELLLTLSMKAPASCREKRRKRARIHKPTTRHEHCPTREKSPRSQSKPMIWPATGNRRQSNLKQRSRRAQPASSQLTGDLRQSWHEIEKVQMFPTHCQEMNTKNQMCQELNGCAMQMKEVCAQC